MRNFINIDIKKRKIDLTNMQKMISHKSMLTTLLLLCSASASYSTDYSLPKEGDGCPRHNFKEQPDQEGVRGEIVNALASKGQISLNSKGKSEKGSAIYFLTTVGHCKVPGTDKKCDPKGDTKFPTGREIISTSTNIAHGKLSRARGILSNNSPRLKQKIIYDGLKNVGNYKLCFYHYTPGNNDDSTKIQFSMSTEEPVNNGWLSGFKAMVGDTGMPEEGFKPPEIRGKGQMASSETANPVDARLKANAVRVTFGDCPHQISKDLLKRQKPEMYFLDETVTTALGNKGEVVLNKQGASKGSGADTYYLLNLLRCEVLGPKGQCSGKQYTMIFDKAHEALKQNLVMNGGKQNRLTLVGEADFPFEKYKNAKVCIYRMPQIENGKQHNHPDAQVQIMISKTKLTEKEKPKGLGKCVAAGKNMMIGAKDMAVAGAQATKDAVVAGVQVGTDMAVAGAQVATDMVCAAAGAGATAVAGAAGGAVDMVCAVPGMLYNMGAYAYKCVFGGGEANVPEKSHSGKSLSKSGKKSTVSGEDSSGSLGMSFEKIPSGRGSASGEGKLKKSSSKKGNVSG